MSKNDDKKRLDSLFKEINEIIKKKSDSDIISLLDDGIVDELLKSLCSKKKRKEQTIYDYFLENKNRLSLLALIRHVITHNYSLKGLVNGQTCYISPTHFQWYENGVMFLQGGKQFEGLIGLYENGCVKFAIATRDFKEGDAIGPDGLLFLDVNECQEKKLQKSLPKKVEDLDRATNELEHLLFNRNSDERKYQDYLKNNPWVLGAQYKKIVHHNNFDDANIPDFTAIRIRDNSRDIIEIKQPFVSLFCKKGTFSSVFNNAWDQAERYLDFARTESEYLYRQKGLNLENPRCYLLIGYNLTDTQLRSLRRKERMNPAISLLTYNDLLVMVKSTVEFVKSLKKKDKNDSVPG